MKLLRKGILHTFSFHNTSIWCLCDNCLFIDQIKLFLCFEKFYISLSLIAVYKKPPHIRRLSPIQIANYNDIKLLAIGHSCFYVAKEETKDFKPKAAMKYCSNYTNKMHNINYIYLLCFCNMFRCSLYHHQGEIMCLLLRHSRWFLYFWAQLQMTVFEMCHRWMQWAILLVAADM